MNIAVVFAGGVGKRMGGVGLPKQFMMVGGEPVIIRTLEKFERHPEVDAVIVSCVAEWIDYLQKLLTEYDIRKVRSIVPGGASGQMSIFNGLKEARKLFPEDSIVLLHDGVRPFIADELISENIRSTKEFGNAVSCAPATETIAIIDDDDNISDMPTRAKSLVAKAPQSFVLKDIYETHLLAQRDGIFDATDSSTLMFRYKKKLHTVMTDYDNIKITTPKDIPLAESIYKRLAGAD